MNPGTHEPTPLASALAAFVIVVTTGFLVACGGEKSAACDSFAELQATFEEVQALDLQSATAADARPLYVRLASDTFDVQQDAEGEVAEAASALNDAAQNAVAAIRQNPPQTPMVEIVSRNSATLAKVETAYDDLAAAIGRLDC